MAKKPRPDPSGSGTLVAGQGVVGCGVVGHDVLGRGVARRGVAGRGVVGCGVEGSVSDPDPDWIRIQSGLWIRIRIQGLKYY